MLNITIHKGASVNTVTVNGTEFDLNAMSPKEYHKFRRELVRGWKKVHGK